MKKNRWIRFGVCITMYNVQCECTAMFTETVHFCFGSAFRSKTKKKKGETFPKSSC